MVSATSGLASSSRIQRTLLQLGGIRQPVRQQYRQFFSGQVLLLDHVGRALGHQPLAVAGLVVVNGVGVRNENGTDARRRQLGDSQGTCPANHHIRPAIGLGHLLDKRLDLGIHTLLLIGRSSGIHMVPATLMKDDRPPGFRAAVPVPPAGAD